MGQIDKYFLKRTSKVLNGTLISQLIVVVTGPFFSRLYSPEIIGLFSLFFVSANFLSNVVSGRYDFAILLPRKYTDAIQITCLCILLSCSICILLCLILLLFGDKISIIFAEKKSVFLFVLSVFFLNFLVCFRSLNLHAENYSFYAKITILKSIILAIIQIGCGYFFRSYYCLLLALIFSAMIPSFFVIYHYWKAQVFKKINIRRILFFMRKYQNFPKFSLISTAISSIGPVMPSFFFSTAYSFTVVGWFELTVRSLSLPSVLLGEALGQVFLKEISKKDDIKSLKVLITEMHQTLALLFMPSLVWFSLSAPFIFSFVFGENWTNSGIYAQILAPIFYFQFLSGPIGNILIVREKQKRSFILQTIMLVLRVSSLGSSFLFDSPEIPLMIYTTASSLGYFLFLSQSFKEGGVSIGVFFGTMLNAVKSSILLNAVLIFSYYIDFYYVLASSMTLVFIIISMIYKLKDTFK